MTDYYEPSAPAAVPAQVEHELQMMQYCRACTKFSTLQHAANALADADDLPASVYFQVGSLLEPSRADHLRRVHPHLFEYERQMEAARKAALGMTS